MAINRSTKSRIRRTERWAPGESVVEIDIKGIFLSEKVAETKADQIQKIIGLHWGEIRNAFDVLGCKPLWFELQQI